MLAGAAAAWHTLCLTGAEQQTHVLHLLCAAALDKSIHKCHIGVLLVDGWYQSFSAVACGPVRIKAGVVGNGHALLHNLGMQLQPIIHMKSTKF